MQQVKYEGDRLNFKIEYRTYEEINGITLCCVVLNEEKTIKPFLEYYRSYVDAISIVDGGSVDKTVEIAAPLVDRIRIRIFDGHYSNQLNRAIEMARTNWVFFIEPDERLGREALESLRGLINQEKYDCYAFPRKEYIDEVNIPDKYPDYQERLFRTYCRRVRPVHGEVVGYHSRMMLPEEDKWNIIHNKDSKIHDTRNTGYGIFEAHFVNELGSPKDQTKDKFEKAYIRLLEGK